VKLLLLTNSLAVGGIEKNIVRLARELSLRGHEVTVASNGGALVQELVDAGGRHEDVHIGGRPDARAIGQLRAVIRDARPDVIHAFSSSAAVLLRLSRLNTHPAVVSSVMGLQTSPDEAGWRILLRAYTTTLGVDRVIVISPAIEEVLRRLPVPRSRFVRAPVVGLEVPNRALWADETARCRLREELGFDQDRPLALTIGRLDPTKSHELLLRASASPAGRTMQWAIIGEGRERAFLEAEIQRLGVASTATLLGERLDAERLLPAADVYVRPGIVEGFVGITVLEAQAQGVPVVSFETEDVKLAIEHETTGLLVGRGDTTALAESVRRLADDPALRSRITTAAHAHVSERFSIDRVATGLERIYSSVLSGLR
jgi:glycosyltransferase involved in cell wall biosynthesis